MGVKPIIFPPLPLWRTLGLRLFLPLMGILSSPPIIKMVESLRRKIICEKKRKAKFFGTQDPGVVQQLGSVFQV